MAEYFTDVDKQHVSLFVDSIFRFVQAGSDHLPVMHICRNRESVEHGILLEAKLPSTLAAVIPKNGITFVLAAW